MNTTHTTTHVAKPDTHATATGTTKSENKNSVLLLFSRKRHAATKISRWYRQIKEKQWYKQQFEGTILTRAHHTMHEPLLLQPNNQEVIFVGIIATAQKTCKLEELSIGSKVDARWKTNGNFRSGQVEKINSNGTTDVIFENGDERKNIPLNEIQHQASGTEYSDYWNYQIKAKVQNLQSLQKQHHVDINCATSNQNYCWGNEFMWHNGKPPPPPPPFSKLSGDRRLRCGCRSRSRSSNNIYGTKTKWLDIHLERFNELSLRSKNTETKVTHVVVHVPGEYVLRCVNKESLCLLKDINWRKDLLIGDFIDVVRGTDPNAKNQWTRGQVVEMKFLESRVICRWKDMVVKVDKELDAAITSPDDENLIDDIGKYLGRSRRQNTRSDVELRIKLHKELDAAITSSDDANLIDDIGKYLDRSRRQNTLRIKLQRQAVGVTKWTDANSLIQPPATYLPNNQLMSLLAPGQYVQFQKCKFRGTNGVYCDCIIVGKNSKNNSFSVIELSLNEVHSLKVHCVTADCLISQTQIAYVWNCGSATSDNSKTSNVYVVDLLVCKPKLDPSTNNRRRRTGINVSSTSHDESHLARKHNKYFEIVRFNTRTVQFADIVKIPADYIETLTAQNHQVDVYTKHGWQRVASNDINKKISPILICKPNTFVKTCKACQSSSAKWAFLCHTSEADPELCHECTMQYLNMNLAHKYIQKEICCPFPEVCTATLSMQSVKAISPKISGQYEKKLKEMQIQSNKTMVENNPSLFRWAGWTIKECPNCRARIEKNAGCDHMKCHVCSTNFSWKKQGVSLDSTTSIFSSTCYVFTSVYNILPYVLAICGIIGTIYGIFGFWQTGDIDIAETKIEIDLLDTMNVYGICDIAETKIEDDLLDTMNVYGICDIAEKIFNNSDEVLTMVLAATDYEIIFHVGTVVLLFLCTWCSKDDFCDAASVFSFVSNIVNFIFAFWIYLYGNGWFQNMHIYSIVANATEDLRCICDIAETVFNNNSDEVLTMVLWLHWLKIFFVIFLFLCAVIQISTFHGEDNFVVISFISNIVNFIFAFWIYLYGNGWFRNINIYSIVANDTTIDVQQYNRSISTIDSPGYVSFVKYFLYIVGTLLMTGILFLICSYKAPQGIRKRKRKTREQRNRLAHYNQSIKYIGNSLIQWNDIHHCLIGSDVRVNFGSRSRYNGIVVEFNETNQKYHIVYENGKDEWYEIRQSLDHRTYYGLSSTGLVHVIEMLGTKSRVKRKICLNILAAKFRIWKNKTRAKLPLFVAGARVSVKWSNENEYKGIIKSIGKNQQHLVVYDDGDRRYYNLTKGECGEIVGFNFGKSNDVHRFTLV